MPQLASRASVSFVRAHSCHGAVCKPQSFGVREATTEQVSVIKRKEGSKKKARYKGNCHLFP